MIRLLLIFLLLAAPLRGDEWWAWSLLEFWRTETSSTGLFLGNRLDDEDGAYVQIASPRHRQALLPWLDLGLGLSLLNIESSTTGERFWQGRPEVELNPHVNLGPQLRLDLRNRMEWRWNEREEIDIHRTRHRLQAAWTLKQPLGPLTRCFVSHEWISDLPNRQSLENRAVPLGLTFRLSDQADLDLFYMLFSVRQQAVWSHESVLGTYLRLRF